jgi:hypothetical protein
MNAEVTALVAHLREVPGPEIEATAGLAGFRTRVNAKTLGH